MTINNPKTLTDKQIEIYEWDETDDYSDRFELNIPCQSLDEAEQLKQQILKNQEIVERLEKDRLDYIDEIEFRKWSGKTCRNNEPERLEYINEILS